jgi:lipopolysaccharide export LptBFGC system permease protein LptF
MNPIKITLLAFGTWIILTVLYVLNFVKDVSEKQFEVAIYSSYLTPFVCIIAFTTSLFFYRSWMRNNRVGFAISSLILIAWSLFVILYTKLLFL